MSATPGPSCTILGGTNGSGKSSLYTRIRPPGVFVNADVIAKMTNPSKPEEASLSAGKEVLRRLARLVSAREDFVYETTLSGKQPLELMESAKRNGYRISLVFVVLESVELNVARVAQRVANGGHNIPEATIRRRYASSIVRLQEALRIADEAAIFDNTSRKAELLLRLKDGRILESRFSDTAPTHLLLSKVVDARI